MTGLLRNWEEQGNNLTDLVVVCYNALRITLDAEAVERLRYLRQIIGEAVCITGGSDWSRAAEHCSIHDQSVNKRWYCSTHLRRPHFDWYKLNKGSKEMKNACYVDALKILKYTACNFQT